MDSITEFPSYSLILGDLHAQIIDIIFVLTMLALLLAFLFWSVNRPKNKDPARKWYHMPLEYIFIILLLSIMFMTNTWDFPIYITVTLAVLLYSYLKRNDFKAVSFAFTLIDVVKIVIVSILLFMPFKMHFFNPTEGVRFADMSHLLSGLYLFKMFVVWGYQIFFVIIFIICIFHTEPKNGIIMTNTRPKPKSRPSKAFRNAPVRKKQEKKVIEVSVPEKKEKLFKRIIKSLNGLSTSDAFALILCICAIGLILVSEVVYQKDASVGRDVRSNTVWKVTLQAFIMFDIVIGYISVRIFSARRSQGKRNALIITIAVILISVMSYCWYGVRQPYYGLVMPAGQSLSLDLIMIIKQSFLMTLMLFNGCVNKKPVISL